MRPSSPALRRAYADGPSGQVHYYDGEGAGVPLVLLHQSPTSAIDFAGTFPAFAAAGVRVVAPDLPGMGMSDTPPAPPTIEDFAEAVFAVMDAAGLACAAILGHHTGAQVALAMAVAQPERVERLVLYGAPVMDAEQRQDHWRRIVPPERDAGAFRPKPGGEHLTAIFARLEALFGLEVAQRMLISRLLAGPQLWYGHNAALTHDMAPNLAASRQPLLLVTHDGEMLDANTRAASRLRPDADLATLPLQTGNALDADPAAFVAEVVVYLTRTRRQVDRNTYQSGDAATHLNEQTGSAEGLGDGGDLPGTNAPQADNLLDALVDVYNR